MAAAQEPYDFLSVPSTDDDPFAAKPAHDSMTSAAPIDPTFVGATNPNRGGSTDAHGSETYASDHAAGIGDASPASDLPARDRSESDGPESDRPESDRPALTRRRRLLLVCWNLLCTVVVAGVAFGVVGSNRALDDCRAARAEWQSVADKFVVYGRDRPAEPANCVSASNMRGRQAAAKSYRDDTDRLERSVRSMEEEFQQQHLLNVAGGEKARLNGSLGSARMLLERLQQGDERQKLENAYRQAQHVYDTASDIDYQAYSDARVALNAVYDEAMNAYKDWYYKQYGRPFE